MIRGFVTIALGGALLVMGAGPAHASSAAPRPGAERPSADQSTVAAPAAPARAGREVSDTREAAVTRALRRGPSLPHPFREQVLPEARV